MARTIFYKIETHGTVMREIRERVRFGGSESLRAMGKRLGPAPKLFPTIAERYETSKGLNSMQREGPSTQDATAA